MFLVLYIDPETNAICSSYLDFISTLNDGTIQIIEVKGDNKIDDTVVQAKAAAALEMASASKMGCLMLESTRIMKKSFIILSFIQKYCFMQKKNALLI